MGCPPKFCARPTTTDWRADKAVYGAEKELGECKERQWCSWARRMRISPLGAAPTHHQRRWHNDADHSAAGVCRCDGINKFGGSAACRMEGKEGSDEWLKRLKWKSLWWESSSSTSGCQLRADAIRFAQQLRNTNNTCF